jgi:AraC-like DNA-binding protein
MRRRGSGNGAGAVDAEALAALGRRAVGEHRLATEKAGGAAVLDGTVSVEAGLDGLCVHATDAVARTDFAVGFAVGPGAVLFVILDGVLDLTLDGAPVRLGREGGAVAELRAFPRPVRVERRARRGERVRKATVTLGRDWFEGWRRLGAAPPPALERLLATPGAALAWTPSPRMARDAERLILGRGTSPLLGRLGAQRVGLDLALAALARFEEAEAPPPEAPAGMAARMAAVRRRLEAHEGPLSVPALAREVGMSESALGRAFRAATGLTPGAYHRRCRLGAARRALVERGVPVAEAARIGGYANPSSFATAFSRAFGEAPSAARAG